MALISLVYTSIAAKLMTDDEMRDILAVSRRNNEKLNVTGMLLYKDGHFIQALEGESEAVEAIYAKIARDPRHTSVYKMFSRPIKERVFSEWEMGFNKFGEADAANLPGFTDFLKRPFDPAFLMEKPSRAVYLLEYFKTRSVF